MKIYLAIPYTFNPEFSHRIANKAAAALMEQGHVVFSPISHSHIIADHLASHIRLDHEFWMDQDLPFIDWADEVHIVIIGAEGDRLISESRGVQQEIARAKRLGKQIKFIEYYD